MTIFNIVIFFFAKTRFLSFKAIILFLKDELFTKLHTYKTKITKEMTLFLPLGLSFKEPNKELLFWGESPNDVLLCLLKALSSSSLVGRSRGEDAYSSIFPQRIP